MLNKKHKSEELIEFLRTSKDVERLHTHNRGGDKDWLYYFDLTGFYKGHYFHVYLYYSKDRGGERHETDIAFTTDNKKDFKELLRQYKLL
jgi:hypothetical protein